MATEQGAGVGPLDRTPPPTSVRWQRETNLPYVRKVYWDQPRERLYAIDDDKNALLVFKNDQLERTITVPDWTPAAVTVDRQGAVWVVDRGESRVLKLNAEGKVLLLVGSSGSRPGYLRKPRGLAVTGDGTVYVADTGNDRVQAFNSEGVFLNVVTSGAGSTELRSPIAITVDGQGILYVASDSYKTIFSFSSDGKFLRVIGDPGPGRGRLETPVDLLVNGNELFVLDGGTGDVKVFSLGGDFLRQFGARGEGRGDFRKPSSITLLDATRLIVADYGNKRLQYLSTVYTPTAPDELGAVGGMRTVNVRWKTPDEPFVEKYRVYRAKEKPEEFKEVALVKTRSYQDTDVVPNLLYYYRIGAVARDGNETVAKEVMKAIPEKYRTAPPQGVEAQTQEWSVDLKWTPNKETFVDHYRVYREDDEEDAVPQMVGETKATNFSEGGLDSDTAYTYYVSAFSTDGVESERTAIDVETPVATKPPLEVDVLEMSNIFSNTYKIYETEGIGRVRLTNNTRDPIGSLKLSLAVKEFMDFPSELEVKNIAPRESREVTLRAVFNNKVLEVTEDTPVQTEITASYYENQKLRTHAKSHTVNLYEKHRMMWVEKDRIATFVTSKDPVLIEFTRAVVTQHGELNAPLVYAGALFEHLGHMGMTYLQHPTNPYQVTAGKTEFVDYVQYPRETLKRNSGVCTDLVVLYAAALESLGIRTLILGIPGHLFMMFDVGAVSDLGDDTMNGMLAIHDGHIWVPVELTIVGAPFMKAWEVGSKTYNDAKAQGIEVTDLRKAWRRFKPATLPFSDWRVTVASRADVDKRFNNEVAKLNKLTLNYTSSRYFKVLQQNPNDVNALLQLGIIYGEGGELDEALRLFERAERISPDNATIKNNIGNIHLMRGKYADAQKVYENAAGLDTSDPYILVNLAICYLRLEKKEKAVDAFQRAYAMDREIGQKYRAMALELLGGI
jgi:DNA-binding beta-propeller fold protein YncE